MTKDDPISEALSEVLDPEMGISVIELGLIYGIERDQGHVEVTMTLTSPGCPVAPEIMAAVHRATLSVEDVESVHVQPNFFAPLESQNTCNGGCSNGTRRVLTSIQSRFSSLHRIHHEHGDCHRSDSTRDRSNPFRVF